MPRINLAPKTPEDMVHTVEEYKQYEMMLKDKERFNCHHKNCIIERSDGTHFLAKIEINCTTRFESPKSEINPANIERITFIINGEPVEFAQCL